VPGSKRRPAHPSVLRVATPVRGATHGRGFTLAELTVVLLVLAVLVALAAMRIGPAADRSAVHAAAMDVAAILEAARTAAVYRRSVVAVGIDTAHGTLVARADSVVLLRRDLRSTYGIRLSASRDSLAFDGRGLGIGLANLSLVARRGAAVDTVFISRLGRVRY